DTSEDAETQARLITHPVLANRSTASANSSGWSASQSWHPLLEMCVALRGRYCAAVSAQRIGMAWSLAPHASSVGASTLAAWKRRSVLVQIQIWWKKLRKWRVPLYATSTAAST